MGNLVCLLLSFFSSNPTGFWSLHFAGQMMTKFCAMVFEEDWGKCKVLAALTNRQCIFKQCQNTEAMDSPWCLVTDSSLCFNCKYFIKHRAGLGGDLGS